MLRVAKSAWGCLHSNDLMHIPSFFSMSGIKKHSFVFVQKWRSMHPYQVSFSCMPGVHLGGARSSPPSILQQFIQLSWGLDRNFHRFREAFVIQAASQASLYELHLGKSSFYWYSCVRDWEADRSCSVSDCHCITVHMRRRLNHTAHVTYLSWEAMSSSFHWKQALSTASSCYFLASLLTAGSIYVFHSVVMSEVMKASLFVGSPSNVSTGFAAP